MKTSIVVATTALMMSLVPISTPAAAAQHKGVRQCHDEWRAHRIRNWARGIKERDYVVRCSGAVAGAVPAAATSSSSKAVEPTHKGKKFVKWRWWPVRAAAPAPAARESTGAAWY